MIRVSDDYIINMRLRRDFQIRADITLSDGTEFTLDSSQITLGNNNLYDGSDIQSFPLGTAIRKDVQLQILNNEEQYKGYDFLGAKIRLYIDFQLGNSTERINKGTYTVVTPETYGETIIITAYDDMYKSDREYTTALTYPQTLGAVLRDVCSSCGIMLGSTSFPHDDFIVQSEPSGTCRDIIGYAAMIAGGNARINTRDQLEIMTYDLDFENAGSKYPFRRIPTFLSLDDEDDSVIATDSHEPIAFFVDNDNVLDEFTVAKIEYNDVVITGIKATVSGDASGDRADVIVGDDTYALVIENPLMTGQEETVLSWLHESIANVPFRPFSGDSISNPLVEFMDLVKVMDRKGNTYNSFITDINFNISGLTTISNRSPSMQKGSLSYSSAASKVEQRTRKLVEKEKTDRELAISNLADKLANSSGLYITTETQPDGSSIYYMHNKPTLAESDIVWKLTAEAIGISTDGGKTYPYGFTVTGELITRLLYAEGINADYIDTGAITVKDSSGNIIFSVDISTKQVIMSGACIMAGTITADKLSVKELSAITADLGTVKAGTIQSKNYESGKAGMRLALSSGEWDSPNFKISGAGAITATSGVIGGWNITADRLRYESDTKIVSLCATGAGTGSDVLYVGERASSSSSWSYPFRLLSDGSLIATKATITGEITATSGSFKGAITAESGKIGGWEIISDRLRYNSDTRIVSFRANGGDVLYVGTRASSSASWSYPFRLYEDGTLVATAADIKGKVTATSGSFTGTVTATEGKLGGWTLTGTQLYNGTITSNTSGNFGMSTADFTRTVAGASRTGLRLAIGSDFGVTKTGTVYCGAMDAQGYIIGGSWGTGVHTTMLNDLGICIVSPMTYSGGRKGWIVGTNNNGDLVATPGMYAGSTNTWTTYDSLAVTLGKWGTSGGTNRGGGGNPRSPQPVVFD